MASIHSLSDFIEAQALCASAVDANICYFGLRRTIGNEDVWYNLDNSPTDYGFANNNGSQPTVGLLPWAAGEPVYDFLFFYAHDDDYLHHICKRQKIKSYICQST